MKTAAFIGAGNMGGAVVEAVCKKWNPKEIVIYVPTRAKAERLAEKTGCLIASSGAAAAQMAKYIFMCVKPQKFEPVLNDILDQLDDDQEHVLVSIAASVPIASMEKILEAKGKSYPVVRLLPNTPVAVGQGLVLMAGSQNVDAAVYEELSTLLAPSGLGEQVDEFTMDVACPVYSCTPAFGALFIEGLSDGGVQIGLPRDKAIRYAAQGILGAAALALESGKHPGQLKDEVCSPGGSTIVGIATLEERGVRSAAAQAIVNAFTRMKSLEK